VEQTIPADTEQTRQADGISCLLVHGLGGGPYELEPLARSLRERGHTVLSLTLPGHEKTGSCVMPASRWEDWARAVEQGFDQLAASGRPVAVAGFSTGGTLALRLALHRPVARLVLLAPFLAIRYASLVPLLKPQQYLKWVSYGLPHVPRFDPPIRNRQARRTFGRTERFRTFNLPATLSALDLIEQVRPQLSEIKTPTLILQGRLDSVVDPQGARTIFESIGSECRELVWLDRSDHLLLADNDAAEVIERSERFLTGDDPESSGS